MAIDRRSFLKLASAASVALLPEIGGAQSSHDELRYDNVFGILVDTTACIGCRQCELACNQEHELTEVDPDVFNDKQVLERMRRPSAEAYTVVNAVPTQRNGDWKSFIKVQCMHCNDPACVSACIVGALTKCEHGPVTYDAYKCIGCRYCMVACPFQIPAYEYDKALEPRVMKCTMCTERVHDGKKPACVAACPQEALTFGKRSDLIALAHSKIEYSPKRYYDHVYGETEAGGTSWLYLTSEDYITAGLPELPHESLPDRTETIQHGIFKSFLPPLALYGLLGLIMHAMNGKDDTDEEVES